MAASAVHEDVCAGWCLAGIPEADEVPRQRVADPTRAVICLSPAISVLDEDVVLRAVEVYEVHRLDFGEAYLVATVCSPATSISGRNDVERGSLRLERRSPRSGAVTRLLRRRLRSGCHAAHARSPLGRWNR